MRWPRPMAYGLIKRVKRVVRPGIRMIPRDAGYGLRPLAPARRAVGHAYRPVKGSEVGGPMRLDGLAVRQ